MRVEITTKSVQKLQMGTKVDEESGDLLVRISVESKLHPIDIARLLNLQKNHAPMFFTLGSQQAELDLEFITIKSEKVEKPVEPTPGPKLVECPQCHGQGHRLDEDTRIDIACSKCEGRGMISAPSETAEVVQPAVTPEQPSDNGSKPKRRQRVAKQPALITEATPGETPAPCGTD